MATLTVNGRRITAAAEQTILDAARAAGIVDIPTLCWYPKLPTVGNCRICLVSVEGQAKLLPACATKVADGMVVQTESHAAVENRKGVLRLLLERYPGDHLRNGGRGGGAPRNEFEGYVVRYGVAPTPLGARDLTLRHGDERPGDPMIRHDMSTCILCTRCVRACEDIQVVGVLDVAQRGEHAEIIVGADGDPDKAGCTWCGECVRVCPTGAIFEVMPQERFAPEQVRRPERTVRSVCPYCGVGCQVDLHVADDKIMRVTSPDIELDTPNQGSTCVKGRFGYDFPQHHDRLTKPLIRRGWLKQGGQWVWRGPAGGGRRGGRRRGRGGEEGGKWGGGGPGGPGAPGGSGAEDRGGGPERQAGGTAAGGRQGGAGSAAARATGPGPARPGGDAGGVVRAVPRGHLGRGAGAHDAGADTHQAGARRRRPRLLLVGQVQQRGELRPDADVPRRAWHQQHRPLHASVPFDLGGGDAAGAEHLRCVGLDARGRARGRRHLHRRGEHHGVPPRLRGGDQARPRAGCDAHRGRPA